MKEASQGERTRELEEVGGRREAGTSRREEGRGRRQEGGGRRQEGGDASRTRYKKGQDAKRRHADKRNTLATQPINVQYHENDTAIVCYNDMFR